MQLFHSDLLGCGIKFTYVGELGRDIELISSYLLFIFESLLLKKLLFCQMKVVNLLPTYVTK